MRARFDRERRLLGGLGEEEGFVPLLGSGLAPDGRPYLVMPLLPGGTLRDRLARGPVRLDEALALGQALARAVGRAPARGIVHRDLKPENVLFRSDGWPLVSDLGLAKHFAGSYFSSRPTPAERAGVMAVFECSCGSRIATTSGHGGFYVTCVCGEDHRVPPPDGATTVSMSSASLSFVQPTEDAAGAATNTPRRSLVPRLILAGLIASVAGLAWWALHR